MTTELPYILINKSQLFRVSVTELDGVTVATPSAVTGTVYDADDATVTSGAGDYGSGYAQYNWAGIATAGRYRAVLTVTMSGGVVISHDFTIEVKSQPPTFTTDISTDIGQVRMEIGDDDQNDGVLPSGKNLSDEQIQALLDREEDVMRAVAAACELLARRWSLVVDLAVGPRRESLSQVAKSWADRGAQLRTQYGGGGSGNELQMGVIAYDFAETNLEVSE